MTGKDPNTARLELLTPWEIDLFIQKCSGKTLEEVATARGYKPRVAELLTGTIYDKTGLAFLSDRQRRSELVSLALSLDAAVRDGTISPPGVEDLRGSPSPEMPSQRALAAVRNDERARQWPIYTFNSQNDDTSQSRTDSSARQRPHHEGEPEEHRTEQADTGKRENREQPNSHEARRQRNEGAGPALWTRKRGALLGCSVAAIATLVTAFTLAALVGVPERESSTPAEENTSSTLPVAQLLPTADAFAHRYEVVTFTQSSDFSPDSLRVQQAITEFELVDEAPPQEPAMTHVRVECIEFIDPTSRVMHQVATSMRFEQSVFSAERHEIQNLGDSAVALTGTFMGAGFFSYDTTLTYNLGNISCRFETVSQRQTFVDELVDVARAAADRTARHDWIAPQDSASVNEKNLPPSVGQPPLIMTMRVNRFGHSATLV